MLFVALYYAQNELKENAEISMGTEITNEDLLSISALAEQVVTLSEYRIQVVLNVNILTDCLSSLSSTSFKLSSTHSLQFLALYTLLFVHSVVMVAM